MIERRGLPGRGGVTLTALTREVIGGFIASMARKALGLTGMIERGRLPRRSSVAITTLSRVMVGRPIGCVAA